MTDPDSPHERDRVAARSLAKLALAALSLALLAGLVSFLPGIDRLVPGTPVSVLAVVGAVAGVAIAGVLLYAARRLAAVTRLALSGPKPLVEDVAAIVHWLVVLAAVLVAHAGLAAIAEAILDDLLWVYDLSFLLLSVPILVVLAVRLYDALDPAADAVAETVAGEGV